MLERRLLSLPHKLGGLGIPIFSEIADIEFENSKNLTKTLCHKIIIQDREFNQTDHSINSNKTKNKIKAEKTKRNQQNLEMIREEINDNQKRFNDLNREEGASTWLTTLPLKDEGYSMTKQLFWDLIHIRYGWELTRLPEYCECGARFNLHHSLSCKKGGFISIRHNNIRNITASLLKEVCKDIRIEPSLQPLTGEGFNEKTANISDEVRCDVSVRGFWCAGQVAFLGYKGI